MAGFCENHGSSRSWPPRWNRSAPPNRDNFRRTSSRDHWADCIACSIARKHGSGCKLVRKSSCCLSRTRSCVRSGSPYTWAPPASRKQRTGHGHSASNRSFPSRDIDRTSPPDAKNRSARPVSFPKGFRANRGNPGTLPHPHVRPSTPDHARWRHNCRFAVHDRPHNSPVSTRYYRRDALP